MPENHQTRSEWLLSRRDDVIEVGDGAVARRDQLLVSARHANDVHDAARRWVDRRDDDIELGISTLRLRASSGVDLAQLSTDLRGGADAFRQYAVTPNHLYSGEPSFNGGPFGLPRPAAKMDEPEKSTSGRAVIVGVLDTGIDEHPWFTDRSWYDACKDVAFATIATENGQLQADTGHGTFVAGILLQQSPGAWVRPGRVLHQDGICDEVQLLHGLAHLHRQCVEAGDTLDLLNLSLGCYTFDDRPSPLIAQALGKFGRGTIIVAAAGNCGSDRPFWPAALKSCIGVAALDTTESGVTKRAEFSNYGWWVDASAPGVQVCSSFVSFKEADGTTFDGYATWSGTSFAAPWMAGAIAELASANDISAADAAELILDADTNPSMPDLGVLVGC
jgi:subtilisin family serine protease